MIDQYGNRVPDDLVLLENNDANLEDAKKIEQLNWYCVGMEKGVFVSSKQLTKIVGYHDAVALKEMYPVIFSHSIQLIAHSLKRWSEADGFYHA